MSITLIDARSDSLTVTWPAVAGASRYILEYKTSADKDYEELSSKLMQTQARKRNLTPETEYFFRVAAVVNDTNGNTPKPDSWVTHAEAFRTLSTNQEQSCMAAPTTVSGGNQALVVSWNNAGDAMKYELQMRENEGGKPWATIAPSLSNTEVKKKNLSSNSVYQFRVRPSEGDLPFSPPSDPAVAKGLSAAMQRWFSTLDDGSLLRSGSNQPVPLADALGGKEFVLLYASAHWCPPCKQYTPQLANWYRIMKNQVEVIFLSADHDEHGFQSYFSTMPWMAVDYDDDTREQLMATIKVTGIPRLVVIHAETGKIVEDNAVGKPLDLNRWRTMSKQ